MNWPECGMRIVRVLTLLICISSSEANADPITFSLAFGSRERTTRRDGC
jgi:hypothetical protein